MAVFCDVCVPVAVPRAVAVDCVLRVETVPDVRRVAARAVASESVAFAPKTAPMPRHTAKNSLIPFIPMSNLSKIMNLRASEKTGFYKVQMPKCKVQIMCAPNGALVYLLDCFVTLAMTMFLGN